MTRFEDCHAALKGVARFERTHRVWDAVHDDQAMSQSDLGCLRSKRWQGVINRHTTPEFAEACRELNLPLVDLNDTPKIPGVPKIRPDNRQVGRVAAEHLIERGFQHFAYDGVTDPWSLERQEGFVEALHQAGHSCIVRQTPYPGDKSLLWNADQVDGLAEWLRELPRPCGVMGTADWRALQILAAARKHELLVPEEFAVIGTNNDSIHCEMSHPPLSSVETNAFLSGYRAAEVLAAMLDGADHGALDERIPPVGVVTRQSTEILAIEDRAVATALSMIRERACRGLTWDELTVAARASRSQLEKKFRRHLGRSPEAEIRRIKLERIRQLLRETDLPLKRIAELSGFDHAEYMSVFFKRTTGLTPGAFRSKTQHLAGDPPKVSPEASTPRAKDGSGD
jgi:LacI family transcriptional regulator